MCEIWSPLCSEDYNRWEKHSQNMNIKKMTSNEYRTRSGHFPPNSSKILNRLELGWKTPIQKVLTDFSSPIKKPNQRQEKDRHRRHRLPVEQLRIVNNLTNYWTSHQLTKVHATATVRQSSS